VARFLLGDHSPIAISAPALRPARPERFICRLPSFSFSSFSLSLTLSHSHSHSCWGDRCFYITGSSSVPCSFFRFGGGRPLHRVHFLIFRNQLKVPTTCFAIFPLIILYRAFLRVHPLSRCDLCPDPHPSMPFLVGFFVSLLFQASVPNAIVAVRNFPQSPLERPFPGFLFRIVRG
jgi:hypothetical protein